MPRNDYAVAAIFAAKNRPSLNPLIIHVGDPPRPSGSPSSTSGQRRLARASLARTAHHRAAARNGIAPSRCLPPPASTRSPYACHAIRSRAPCCRPSAGRSQHPAPISPAALALRPPIMSPSRWAEALTAISKAGRPTSDWNPPSSSLSGRRRACCCAPAALPIEAIEAVIGPLVTGRRGGRHSRTRHAGEPLCARALPLRLDVAGVRARTRRFSPLAPNPPAGAKTTLNLSAAGDLDEAAANLFAFLRRLDDSVAAAIAVMPIPEKGLGRAINDRLRRAAAPRSTT